MYTLKNKCRSAHRITHTHTEFNLCDRHIHRIKAFCRHSAAWFSEPYWVILAALVQPTKIDFFVLTRGGSFILLLISDSLG